MLATTLVIVTLLSAALTRGPLAAPGQAACAAPEARQLDFWIGDWDLSGRQRTADGWRETPATNHVRAALGGCVIHEEFRMATPDGLQGMSVSVYDARAGLWRQTWVDNQGSYLMFQGAREGDRVILATAPRTLASGDTLVARMVFHDLAADRFVWDWERSTDAGRSWTLQWTLEYRRRS